MLQELESMLISYKKKIINEYAYNQLEADGIENIISISFDENKGIIIDQRPRADLINKKYYDCLCSSFNEDRAITSNAAILMVHFRIPGYAFVIDVVSSSNSLQYIPESNLWEVEGFRVRLAELYRIVDAYINHTEANSNSSLYWFIVLRHSLCTEQSPSVEKVRMKLPSDQLKYWSKALYHIGYKYYIEENIDEAECGLMVVIEKH